MLAHLHLGRALAMIGDKAAARKSYQDFLTLRKDAESRHPHPQPQTGKSRVREVAVARYTADTAGHN